jgi:hypothetical protein
MINNNFMARTVREARDRLRPQIDEVRRESRKLEDDEQLLKKSNLNLQARRHSAVE